jgi:hypothetical protein
MRLWTYIFAALFLTACGAGDDTIDDDIDPLGSIDAQAPDFGQPGDATTGTTDGGAVDSGEVTCPVGLRPNGADCVSAVPVDPVFSDPGAWQPFGGASLGSGLQLDRASICQPGGSGATTTLELGDYSDVGPLFVTVDLQYDLCDDPGVGLCEPSSILFARTGESVIQIATPFGLGQPQRSVSFCLPSSAYGGSTELAIWFREYEEEACSSPDTRTVAEAIRSVRIAQVGDSVCPDPGNFPDPGFERSFPNAEPTGWVVNTGGTGDVSVRGSDLDREVLISLDTGCSNAQMQQTTRVPVPADPAKGIALQFDQDISAGTPLQVRVGPMQRYLVGLEPGTRPLCVPSYLWGRAEEVLFRVTGTTDCTEDSLGYNAIIDDLEFVELAECGPAGIIRDGAFEADLLTTWNVSVNGPDAIAAVPPDETFVRLATQKSCGAATVEQWISPRPDTTAVQFDYRATLEGDHGVNLRPLGISSFSPAVLPPVTDWTTVSYCLPQEPRLPVSIAFTEFAPDSVCGALTQTALEVRNAQLLADPNCEP